MSKRTADQIQADALKRLNVPDGGPAYPATRPEAFRDESGAFEHYADCAYPGMSLRDWFAGQALITVLDGRLYGTANVSEAAGLAYRVADAMLKARTT